MTLQKNRFFAAAVLGTAALIAATIFFGWRYWLAGRDTTVLTIWHTEVDPNAQAALKDAIADFQKTHPGVQVEIEAVSWNNLSQKLAAAMASGDVPDLTHLEPFMTASLHRRGQLLPLDDLVSDLGKEDIFPGVRDLQYFDGHYYGIAYAVGTTFFAVRTDLLREANIQPPRTWAEFIDAARRLTVTKDGKSVVYGVALPGDPFFIDQFATELVASNGGRLYDDKGMPAFTEKPVVEMLQFWKQLSKFAPPTWTHESYLGQFQQFAAGKVAMVPVCYGRALKNIENDAPAGLASPEHYGFIPQPHGPSGTAGFATMDCENWAILKGAKHPQLAIDFLKCFYKRNNYLAFCRTVPIHLTPILKSVAESQDYLNAPLINRWPSWQTQTNQILAENRALPIMLSRANDRNLPYLMELQGSRIITDMVLDVCANNKTPEEAAARGQQRAMELVTRLRK